MDKDRTEKSGSLKEKKKERKEKKKERKEKKKLYRLLDTFSPSQILSLLFSCSIFSQIWGIFRRTPTE